MRLDTTVKYSTVALLDTKWERIYQVGNKRLYTQSVHLVQQVIEHRHNGVQPLWLNLGMHVCKWLV